MQDLKQPQIIAFGPKKAGRRLGSVPWNALPSALPGMAGKLFGRLKVVSGEVIQKKVGGRSHLLVECSGCGQRSLKEYTSLVRGTAGCRSCAKPRQAPKWLVMRALSAKQRCTNPNDQHYHRYGGRGIRFGFESATAMAVWVQENIGLHKEMELDRIDNDGHYAPGNLRWLSRHHNGLNRKTKKQTATMHLFRQTYPEVRYADSTLAGLIGKGLSFSEIVQRWNRPSCKPKGVYGTFSTPDRAIASLAKGS